MLRISSILDESIVDGPGLRLTVFTQGCPHRCEGCHNPQTHDPSGGYEIDINEILKRLDKNPLLDGITLTGGEPLMQAGELIPLAKGVKERNLSVIVYSGYTFEEIIQNDEWKNLLSFTDILIDGRFEIEQRSLDLMFKGSKNQRVIDVKSSLVQGTPVLYDFES